MAAKSPEFADEARRIVRQIDVLASDIAGGLHEGEALFGVAPETICPTAQDIAIEGAPV